MESKEAAASDVVFLIPGFLGFERIGNFSYFADRVSAALRACLEDRLGRTVHVVPVPILPTGSFPQRQRALVKTLCNRMAAFEDVDRVHLVGHSTGGVDAQLLTLARPLEQASWADHDGVDARPLRDRLRSVVSVASPHHGTGLADDAVARFLAQGLRAPAGALPFAALVGKLLLSAGGDLSASEMLLSIGREGHKVWKFLSETLRWHDLIEALRPERMAQLYLHAPPDLPEVRRASIVSIAGLGGGVDEQGRPNSDAFFEDMARRTGGRVSLVPTPPVARALGRLQNAIDGKSGLITHPKARLPARLDVTSSDGIVNSARQLINPDDPEELAGIVVADHFDVVGYYDRETWVTDENGVDRPHQVVSGLLHSGSRFGDTEFFKLYRRIAHVIAREALE